MKLFRKAVDRLLAALGEASGLPPLMFRICCFRWWCEEYEAAIELDTWLLAPRVDKLAVPGIVSPPDTILCYEDLM